MPNSSLPNEATSVEHLTKKVRNGAVRKSIREASEQILETTRSVASTKDNWLVLNYPDGRWKK